MVNVAPTNKAEPPDDAVNQEICSGDDAVKETVPGPHRDTSDADGGFGHGVIIACAAVRVALRQVLPASA